MDNKDTTAPAASTEKSAGTETNTNSTPEVSEEPKAQPVTAEQVAEFFKTDADTVKKVAKFAGSNGGFSKTFEERKLERTQRNNIPSNSHVEPPQTRSDVKDDKTYVQEQKTQPQPREGYLTARDLNMLSYRDRIASEKKYAAIVDYINKGDFLKEMAELGIRPIDDNGINDAVVRRFLDLKAAGVANKQSVDVVSSSSPAPTISYTEVADGKISSMEQARKIFMERGNPNHQLAVDYLKNQFSNK